MAQFTVYRNKNPSTQSAVPYLLDIQSDLLENLETRVVVPLYPTGALRSKAMQRLTPVLEIEGEPFLMVTPQLAGISRSDLGAPIARIEQQRFTIIAAVDFLVTGI
jgi:toxin CcdB